jgi:hypothetical protein
MQVVNEPWFSGPIVDDGTIELCFSDPLAKVQEPRPPSSEHRRRR